MLTVTGVDVVASSLVIITIGWLLNRRRRPSTILSSHSYLTCILLWHLRALRLAPVMLSRLCNKSPWTKGGLFFVVWFAIFAKEQYYIFQMGSIFFCYIPRFPKWKDNRWVKYEEICIILIHMGQLREKSLYTARQCHICSHRRLSHGLSSLFFPPC